MATKPEYLALAVLFSILLVSCASDLSEGFSYDYPSAKVSDFNGRWTGYVDCNYANKYLSSFSIQISNGVGELRDFGNYNEGVTADLDLQSGKIRWTGSFIRISGNPDTFYLNGQWRDKEFRVKGQRGSFNCSGEATR